MCRWTSCVHHATDLDLHSRGDDKSVVPSTVSIDQLDVGSAAVAISVVVPPPPSSSVSSAQTHGSAVQ
jgi:hypothetical protein